MVAVGMPKSDYDPQVVYQLRTALWASAYSFAKRNRISVSGLELLTALHIMEEETRHHGIEDKKTWNNILESSY
jgi:hypothetical protein